jgi:hypothetical protein
MSVEQVFGAVIVAVILWFGRTLLAFAKEMTEWRVELFGKNGNNGMRGELKSLRRDVDGLMGKRYDRRASDVA